MIRSGAQSQTRNKLASIGIEENAADLVAELGIMVAHVEGRASQRHELKLVRREHVATLILHSYVDVRIVLSRGVDQRYESSLWPVGVQVQTDELPTNTEDAMTTLSCLNIFTGRGMQIIADKTRELAGER